MTATSLPATIQKSLPDDLHTVNGEVMSKGWEAPGQRNAPRLEAKFGSPVVFWRRS